MLWVGLARLTEISVNWSIDTRKTIIDERNETIGYLLLLFVKISVKNYNYFAFSVFKTSNFGLHLDLFAKPEKEAFVRLV